MASSPLRDQSAGFHHVVCRGNNKRDVFGAGGQRSWFLHLLDEQATSFGWEIHAYALMRNHYHLLLRIEEGRLAEGMHRLNTGYATWFNRRERRINHLFGRRYWSERLKDEYRYLAALRYVVRNPARAGMPGPLVSQTWTSYPASLGLDWPPIRLARRELLAMFDRRPAVAEASYRRFCEAEDGPLYSRRSTPGRPPSRRGRNPGSLRFGTVTDL
jgi:REP element-mobilizing transposase RayT